MVVVLSRVASEEEARTTVVSDVRSVTKGRRAKGDGGCMVKSGVRSARRWRID